jgi:hypothetical protein
VTSYVLTATVSGLLLVRGFDSGLSDVVYWFSVVVKLGVVPERLRCDRSRLKAMPPGAVAYPGLMSGWTGVTKRMARDPKNKHFEYADTVAPKDAPADYQPPQSPAEWDHGDLKQAPQQTGTGEFGY